MNHAWCTVTRAGGSPVLSWDPAHGSGVGFATEGMRLVIVDPNDPTATGADLRNGYVRITSPAPWPKNLLNAGSLFSGSAWIDLAHIKIDPVSLTLPVPGPLKVGKRYIIEVVEELA